MSAEYDLKLIVSILALIVSVIPKAPKLSDTFPFRLSKFTQFIIGYLNNFGSLTAIVAVFFLILNTLSQSMLSCNAAKQVYYNITYYISFSIIFIIILIIFISALSLLVEIKIPGVRKWVI